MSIGIDILIDACVTNMTAKLWKAYSPSFKGRIFRNEVNGKIKPEYYVSANEYQEVLTNDTLSATCFFDVLPTHKYLGGQDFEAEMRACFMLNLATLYSTYTRTEATEAAKYDILKYLQDFDVIQAITGYEGFKDYDFTYASAKGDMSPYYLIRFDLKVNYSKC